MKLRRPRTFTLWTGKLLLILIAAAFMASGTPAVRGTDSKITRPGDLSRCGLGPDRHGGDVYRPGVGRFAQARTDSLEFTLDMLRATPRA